MAILHGTPLPNLAVKVVFLGIVVLGWLISPRSNGVPRRLRLAWAAFVTYVLIESAYFVFSMGYSLSFVFFSYNAYYFAILLLPMLFHFRQTLSESAVTRSLLLSFIPLSILGITQNVFGKLLLPTDSPNGYLQVMSWDFFGSVRAFSLFSSPSQFGHFLAIVAGFGCAYYLHQHRRSTRAIVLTALALAAGYCTLTRATQLEIACTIVTVWMIYRRPANRRLLSLLPILYGGVGLLAAFVLPVWLLNISGENLGSNLSLVERYLQWSQYGPLWLSGGMSNFLFGTGMIQNGRFQASADVVVDNSFLAVGLHIGIIGVLLWLLICWFVWGYMLTQLQSARSPLRVAAAAAFSTWLLTSVFNITIFYPLPFVIFLITNLGKPKHPAPLGLCPNGDGIMRNSLPLSASL